MLFAIPDLRASRVNLLMNDFAAGLPSPLAFLGLGAAVAPVLGAPRWSIGVLPVLHEVHVSEGRTKAEMASGGGRFTPVEIVEDLVGSVRVSLLMDVPGCNDAFKVESKLLGRRIAGGTISNEKVEVKQVTFDGTALAALPRGYAMIAPHDPARRIVATGAINALSAVADVLFPAERAPGAGWLIPVAVGHRLLENPSAVPHRANTRNPNVPHVFTEPVVGIAELISIRSQRLTHLDENGMKAILWRWKAEGEWIVGHPNYHPDRCATAEQEYSHVQQS